MPIIPRAANIPSVDMRLPDGRAELSARKVCRDNEWLAGFIGEATYLRSLLILGYDLPSAKHELSLLEQEP